MVASTSSPPASVGTTRRGASAATYAPVTAGPCASGSVWTPGRFTGSGVFCARRPSCFSCSTFSLALALVWPLWHGACTWPEPLRRSSAHASARSAGVASDGGPRPHRRRRHHDKPLVTFPGRHNKSNLEQKSTGGGGAVEVWLCGGVAWCGVVQTLEKERRVCPGSHLVGMPDTSGVRLPGVCATRINRPDGGTHKILNLM